MSRIGDLISQICPNGVKYRELGDISEVRSGWGFPKGEQGNANGDFAFYKVGDMNLPGNEILMTRANNYVSEDTILRLGISPAPEGAVIFPKIGAAIATNKKRILAEASAYDNNVMGVIPGGEVLPRFLFYVLQTIDFSRVANDSGAVPSIRKSDVLTIRVPVPPLELQREAIRILDKFTDLLEQLETELDARRRQRGALVVNFAVAHRDRVGRIESGRATTLGQIAVQKFERVEIEADQEYVSLGVKWAGAGVLTRGPRSGREIKAATMNVARSGQLIYNRMFAVEGSFAIVPPECDGAVVSNEFPLFELDTVEVDSDWLMTFFQDTHTLAQIESEVTGVERGSMKARRRWNEAQFKNFELNLPSLTEQQKVAKMVRSSDALIDSLNAELDARRMQYEYYRDKLLSFDEAPE